MKDNQVANILSVTGYVIITIGFIMGIAFGRVDYGYEVEMIWSVVFLYWFSSFISGMLFIGLSEIIEVLSRIDQKLSNVSKVKRTATINEVSENQIDSEKSPQQPTIYNDKQLTPSNHEKEFIQKHFDKREITINKIIKTPFSGLFLIQLQNGEDKIYDIGGFQPEEVPSNKWDERINVWYKDYTDDK